MKLLFDHHLSRKLVERCAEDTAIWDFARTNQFTSVTKDSDFNDMSTLYGAPPKIIWIRIGNCTTATIKQVIRRYATEIEQFIMQSPEALLEIIPTV